MDVEIIAVGKTTSKSVGMLVEEYASRLPHYIPFKITYLPDLKNKLSLSKMTFNHEMVRAFAVEQVYRAMTILRGEPYHHD